MTCTPARAARAAAWATAAVAAVCLARRASLRWGATTEEVAAALPGDDLVPHPDLVSTRAITVHAAPEDVWPWVVQLGQGRGGFYSYDVLENLVGCDIHSADEVVEEWQHLAVGDRVNLAPQVALEAAEVIPGSALVLRGAAMPNDAPSPYDFAWAFVLRPAPGGGTRLVVRERYAYLRRWAVLMVEPVEWVSMLMSQKMLRGIRDRAERVGCAGRWESSDGDRVA